jgi:hypothetical protein
MQEADALTRESTGLCSRASTEGTLTGGCTVAANYYVNTQAQNNGDHEVHKDGCTYLPSILNRKYLGAFDSCVGAVREARKYHTQVNGCYYCSNACHTQ